MNTEEQCVVDPTRPCGACSAPGPRQCPYRYLLDADELGALRARLTGRDGPPRGHRPASVPPASVPSAA